MPSNPLDWLLGELETFGDYLWRQGGHVPARGVVKKINDLRREAAVRRLDYDQATAGQQAWDLQMEQELRDEETFEARLEAKRWTEHTPRIGALGPNFCEVCGANIQRHETIPYGGES